ncbi:MAG TPA: GDP-mannose mannosyl hydrolase [Candidatus Sulfotelmatobacter sp.]|nr:GDP-mannose mannosyl hydrolase [Candidatus Sulfotelmatobacter sp.]HWI56177.1 GDP-mannose mannosyl hydrolase [Bacillota bacterium]
MSIKEALPASERSEPQPGAWLDPKDFESVVRLTPLIAIDLIVRSPEGRILVGRRKNEPARNTLFVPGGRITKNETKAAAFRRLTREELGVEIGIEEARFIGAYEHFYATNRLGKPGFGTHYIVLAYALNRSVPAEALPNDQHGEYVWMGPSELLACAEVHENTKAYFRT